MESSLDRSYPGTQVLLVEDDTVNREIVQRQLRAFGLELQVASNGAEALECIQARSFDLVFMDCLMPVMDGFEATRAVRSWEARLAPHGVQKRLPIIALTADATSEARERCLQAGMDDYVVKPVRREALCAVLTRRLEPQTRAALASSPAPGAGTEGSRNVTTCGPGLDPQRIDFLRSMFPDGLARIVDTYLREARGHLAAAAEAADRRDYQRVLEAAHILKSSSRTMGASDIAQLAGRLESLARQHSPDAAALLPAVESALENAALQFSVITAESSR